MAMKNCSARGSMARGSSDLALAIQPAQPFGIMNKISVGDFLVYRHVRQPVLESGHCMLQIGVP